MLINLKKNHPLMFKVYLNLFAYSNIQMNLFMNIFALIFDFKQVQSCVYSRHIV